MAPARVECQRFPDGELKLRLLGRLPARHPNRLLVGPDEAAAQRVAHASNAVSMAPAIASA